MPAQDDAKKIFISHATADKALASRFVKLLQTGLSITHPEIFCSSGPGTGVPSGREFKQYIENELLKTNFAIALISPSYFESTFCVCELGAIWVLKPNFIPLLVPPQSYKELEAVSTGLLAEKIDSEQSLDNLHQALMDAGWGIGNTARWNAMKDEFLEDLKTIEIAKATNVAAHQFSELTEKYRASQQLFREQSSEVIALKEQIKELEKIRPAAAVQKVTAQFSGKDPFEELLSDFKKITRSFSKIVWETVYKDYCGKSSWTPNTNEDRDAWDNAVKAAERKLLIIDGDEENGFTISCDDSHTQIEEAKDKLKEIDQFIRDEAQKSNFIQTFNEKHKYKFDVENRDFWDDYLR
ncbi:toll/interleukin-1 receptor domain-containing protein [bacterium]|nr:toll/interleukin-1 receptor domain-containing protein [bacterium]MBP9811265.1 toll/interleukin-1 receptor domain-containing protein [bacterium]